MARRCFEVGWGRVGTVAALAAFLLLILAAPLQAHLALRGSAPAAGAELERVPTELRLDFTEPVEFGLATLRLTGRNGPVPLGSPGPAGGDRQQMVAAIEGTLVAGEYRVDWQAVGLDGHPVRGSFSFTIVEGAEGLAPPADPLATADTVAAIGPTSPELPAAAAPDDPTSDRGVFYAAVRWLLFASIIALVGALAFRGLLARPRLLTTAAPGFAQSAARGAAAAGALAATALLLSIPLRLQAQSHSIFGGGVTLERLSLLLDTTWGRGWALQLAAALVALVGMLIARAGGRWGWPLAGVATAIVLITPGLSGHAAAAEPFPVLVIAADALHMLGAGVWLGTLLMIVVVAIPLLRDPSPPNHGRTLAALVAAFSPLALAGAAVLIVTGLLATSLHLTGPFDLVSTPYGRTLLGKLLFVVIVLTMGFYNWRRLSRRLEAPAASRELLRSAAVELTATTLVLLMTSILVAIPPPAHAAHPDGGAAATQPQPPSAEQPR